MTEKDDLLWERCRRGDLKAFEALYMRFYPLLFNYGIKLINDADLVQDCIQDLFVKLIQNHSNLSSTNQVKGYIFKSFRHKLFDSLETYYKVESIEPYADNFVTDDLFQKLFQAEKEFSPLMKQLLKVYAQLSPKQQEIIYLYFIDELSHREIAEMMDINYQSSKNHLSRAMAKLRALLNSVSVLVFI